MVRKRSSLRVFVLCCCSEPKYRSAAVGCILLLYRNVYFSSHATCNINTTQRRKRRKPCINHDASLGLKFMLTVSLILCRSRSNTPGKLRALEGRRGSSISLWRVWDRNMRVAGRNGRNGVSRREVIDLPSRQINDFFTKKKTEIIS